MTYDEMRISIFNAMYEEVDENITDKNLLQKFHTCMYRYTFICFKPKFQNIKTFQR